jgi:hypothetical protein
LVQRRSDVARLVGDKNEISNLNVKLKVHSNETGAKKCAATKRLWDLLT